MKKFNDLLPSSGTNNSLAVPKESEAKDALYTIPSTPASQLLLEAMGAGEELLELSERKQQINHNEKIEVYENGKSRRIIKTSPKAEVTIEIKNIDVLAGNNKSLKKFFVLTLLKANMQSLHNGELSKVEANFSLQELVDIGFYKNLDSARKGFKNAMRILEDIKIGGKIKLRKNKEIVSEGEYVMFTGWKISNSVCSVFLNNQVNWQIMTQYYTHLPRYYFALSNKASDLLYYIFEIARQRTDEIKKNGYFNISFNAIHGRLHLPAVEGNTNPQRDIRQPIEEAIEEIEEAQLKVYDTQEIQLLLVNHETKSIKEYLEKGYLKVTLNERFSEGYVKISEGKTKRIKAEQTKVEKAKLKALEKAEADKLKNQEEKEK